MSDFRLEKNVPDVYVDESRDFQLLCRILDIYLKGCIDRASNMVYQLDLDKCNEQLLYAIANMQGFTTNLYIPPNVLRNICKVFPYCLRRKGTEEAIRTAAYAVFSADRLIYQISVNIYGRGTETGGTTDPTIQITCDAENSYLPYLKEVLRFIIPTGWRISYRLLGTINREVTTNVYVSSRSGRYSGIMSRIMGNNLPLNFTSNYNMTEPYITKDGMYSKVGMAKVYRYIENETGIAPNGNGGVVEEELLTNNTIPVFIGVNTKITDT